MAPADRVRVEVAYCPQPGVTDRVTLELASGATVADAVQLSGLVPRHSLQADNIKVGVWSRVKDLQTLLRDQDRVEIYRPLRVDPKEARRLRYKSQKARKPQNAPIAPIAPIAPSTPSAPSAPSPAV